MMTGTLAPAQVAGWLWLIVPVVAGVILGHMIHVRISERNFQRWLLIGMVAAGTALLLK